MHINDRGTSGGVAADAHPQAAAAPRLHYRPQLDGLRALAVYLVVAYHAGLHAFSGGFIGVDVFFVLSGYLVTAAAPPRHSLARAGSTFAASTPGDSGGCCPAAFVTLVVTAVVYTAVAAPADVNSALGGFRSAFLYVANWHFIRQSNDYFAANVNTNPVVHFWSLAVEEQFYLCLAPARSARAYFVSGRAGRPALEGSAADRRRRRGDLAGRARCTSRPSNVSRAYYGTDTRAYELLAGALLALTPRALVRGAASHGARCNSLRHPCSPCWCSSARR